MSTELTFKELMLNSIYLKQQDNRNSKAFISQSNREKNVTTKESVSAKDMVNNLFI